MRIIITPDLKNYPELEDPKSNLARSCVYKFLESLSKWEPIIHSIGFFAATDSNLLISQSEYGGSIIIDRPSLAFSTSQFLFDELQIIMQNAKIEKYYSVFTVAIHKEDTFECYDEACTYGYNK